MAIELFPEITRVIGREADRLGVDAYIVGGVVRDFFLQRPCTDIDIVCIGHDNGGEVHIGIELAKASSRALGGSKVSVFKNFGTASFRIDNSKLKNDNSADTANNSQFSILNSQLELEFVGARRESYSRDSRKPIVENGTLEDDQRRRDFTVNALAVCINHDRYGELVDPFGGIRDLDQGILRTPLDPDITFSDDPLRMMRALRFAAQLGFRIDDSTFEAIARNAKRIEIVSAERITVELNKIILSPNPSLGLKLMQKCGLMQLILPEISALQGVETVDGRGHKDIFYHTMTSPERHFEEFKKLAPKSEQDLIPVVDVETLDHKSPELVRKRLIHLLDLMEQYYGKKPIIYTHDWFYNKYLKCKRIDKHKLMIANYNGKEPSCDYCIWQFTETGRLKGIKSHHVDLSRFNKNYTIADILLVND